VEYMGKFAEKAASGAASGAAPAAPATPAASGIDQDAMNKGLSGLK
jgi:hypothetical protein